MKKTILTIGLLIPMSSFSMQQDTDSNNMLEFKNYLKMKMVSNLNVEPPILKEFIINEKKRIEMEEATYFKNIKSYHNLVEKSKKSNIFFSLNYKEFVKNLLAKRRNEGFNFKKILEENKEGISRLNYQKIELIKVLNFFQFFYPKDEFVQKINLQNPSEYTIEF